MHQPFLREPRAPFPVATQTREGDPYRSMHPRLAAIDLLREKCVDGKAGVDIYDPAVFILDALPHEIVWARTCINLCGVLLGERQLDRGRVRYSGHLAADVRDELDLDIRPRRYLITDEPLASRAVDTSDEAILHVLHPDQPHLELVAPDNVVNVDFVPVGPEARRQLDRAAQLAALRVDCGCGAPTGQACRCTVGERLASAIDRGELTDDEKRVH